MVSKKSKTVYIASAVVMLFCIATACSGIKNAGRTEPAPPPEVLAPPLPPPVIEEIEPPYVCTCQTPTGSYIEHDVKKPDSINSHTPQKSFIVGTALTDIENDTDIKTLISGYKDTFWTTPDGQIKLNQSVVCRLDTEYDDEGNKTFTFTLHNYLKWNNGEPITAADYVAGIPAEEPSEYIRGVELLDDYRFSATIDSSYLPFFWEYSLVTFSPVYASEEDTDTPSVTCGPYVVKSYDDSTVTLERNEHFGVCPEGYMPYFDTIIQTAVPSSQAIQMLQDGEIDFYQNINTADIEQDDYLMLNRYPRAGYGFLEFVLDYGPTADIQVRSALASIIGSERIIDEALSGNGIPAQGPFSPAQWVYQMKQSEVNTKLKTFETDINTANEYLDRTQWVYQADGETPFDAEKAGKPEDTYLRHNSEGEPLRIAVAADSPAVGAVLSEIAKDTALLAGVELIVEQVDFKTLLHHYYYGKTLPAEERRWNMFHIAVDFTPVDDKFWSYHSTLAETPLNTNGVSDEQLDNLTMKMRNLNPEEKDEYAELWLEFQMRRQQVFPTLPLYVNIYTDACNNIVTQIPTTAFASYADMITHISKHE